MIKVRVRYTIEGEAKVVEHYIEPIELQLIYNELKYHKTATNRRIELADKSNWMRNVAVAYYNAGLTDN